MMRWVLWIGIVIVVISAGGGAYYFFAQDETNTVAAATSRTMQASRGDIEVKISGTGTVKANSRATVSAGTNGTIEKLGFNVGDTVKKGQVLVVFESEDVSSQISQLKLNMKKKQIQMDQYETQFKEATGTEKEVETKQTITINIDMLELEMDQDELSLKELKEQQAETTQVVSPIDGTITASELAVGDVVQGNAVIAEIVDYTALTFIVQVDELDIPQMNIGQAAQVHLNALPDTTYEGKVAVIAKEGTASNGVSAYDVTITLSKIEGVIAGMSGQVDIITASKKDVVVVPVDAVVEMRGATFVRVPNQGGASVGNNAKGQAELDGAQGGQGAAGGTQGTQGGQDATGGTQGAQGGQGAVGGTQGGQSGQGATGGISGQGMQSGRGATGSGMTRPGGMQMEGQLREVTTGISNETFVEIVSGLDEGDSVLVPLPQGTVGKAVTQTDVVMPGGFGGMQFPSGGMGGGAGGASGFGGGGGGIRTQGGTR